MPAESPNEHIPECNQLRLAYCERARTNDVNNRIRVPPLSFGIKAHPYGEISNVQLASRVKQIVVVQWVQSAPRRYEVPGYCVFPAVSGTELSQPNHLTL